jgi:hypothetical protein
MIIIPGIEMGLGGKQRIVPPMNAATVKQFRDKINSVGVNALPDIEIVSLIAYHSLKRNYPDITQEEVDEFIDNGNMVKVWEAMMNLNGLAYDMGKMMRRVHEAGQEAIKDSGLMMPLPTS